MIPDSTSRVDEAKFAELQRQSQLLQCILHGAKRNTRRLARILLPIPEQMEITNVLVPTDFSESADNALSYALGIAKRFSAKLHVLHVPVVPTYLLMDASYTPGPEAVIQIFEDAQRAIDALEPKLQDNGVQCQTALREGVVHTAVKEYAEEHRVDLLVMGTHGRTGVSKLMYGSVTERVLKTVHTPTVVVPPEGGEPPDSIVVAYDFSRPAKRAAEAARAVQEVFDGRVHFVHAYLDVWGEYTDRGALVGEAAEQRRAALTLGLKEMLEADATDLFPGDSQTETRLVTGDPVGAILDVAEDVGADLICAGTTGKSGIARLLMGSFARRVVHEGTTPVLLVHAQEEGEH